MSMLSKQADELRALAGDGSVEWVAGPIRTSVLREAADTILGLRDRAQELKAENASLRDGYEAYEHRMDCLVSSLTGGLLSKSASTPNDVIYEAVQEEMTEELLAENARLRELVRELYEDQCCDTDRWKYRDRICEMGIEVG